MQITTIDTFWVRIYLGLKSGDLCHKLADVQTWFQDYTKDIPCCVTLDSTTFVYRGGMEPGVVIGMINYPRFPQNDVEIMQEAIELAELLRKDFGQKRVSVVSQGKTVLVGEV